MKSLALRVLVTAVVLLAMAHMLATDAAAQCATCPTPTVAFSPVLVQPTVALQPATGWYPGRLLDQWRLRRAGVLATAPTYTAAYAPTYTAAYAPTYTAAYAPTYTAAYAPTYTAAYAPTYTAAYAPSYTTAYQPYVSSYAPMTPRVQTVSRAVVMQPIVAAPVCNTCSFTPDCGCDACGSSVSQAVYSESSAPACPSCVGSVVGDVMQPASSPSQSVGPQTPQPSFTPAPTPADSEYRRYPPRDNGGAQNSDPSSDDVVPPIENDPGPTSESDPSTYYEAPRLLDPSDRTARTSNRQPTVEVWTAVYRGPAQNRKVQQTSSQRARTQAEIDADGWTAVPPSTR